MPVFLVNFDCTQYDLAFYTLHFWLDRMVVSIVRATDLSFPAHVFSFSFGHFYPHTPLCVVYYPHPSLLTHLRGTEILEPFWLFNAVILPLDAVNFFGYCRKRP